jgi:hypothetical protein
VTTPAARRRDALTSAVVEVIVDLMPDVDTEMAAVALAESAKTSPALQGALEHLRSHPDALQSGSSNAPNVVIKLAHALHERGITGVVVPGCAVCGRVVREMRRADGVGAVCQVCYLDSKRRECAVCGEIGRIVVRDAGGPVCSRCHQRDPGRHEPCEGCGKPRRVAHRDEHGRPRCARCYSRPRQPCSSCGAIDETTAFTEAGPVCPRCYVHPKRRCGRCGRVRAISRRATDQAPDLCYSCDRGRENTCSGCGQRRSCKGRRDGKPICERCYVQPSWRCDFCGEQRPITATWASGAVCWSCYPRLRRHHRNCPKCKQPRTLTEVDTDGTGICAECAGSGPTYRCGLCNGPSDGYLRDMCARCALAEQVSNLLAGSRGAVPPTMRGIQTALCEWPNPRSVLTWLDRSAGAAMLAELAQKQTRLTHADLDAYPPSKFEHHLRRALIHAGALPDRDEPLERIDGWLDEILRDNPGEHAQLVRPFAQWVVLRRARQRSQRKPTTEAAASWARQRVRTVLDLLAWLYTRATGIGDLDQAALDEWLATGSSTRYTVRDFVIWATKQRLVTDVHVPRRQIVTPEEPLDEDDRWKQLQACIHDPAMPLRIRVGGALVLLYGHPVSRIVALRAGQVHERDDGVYLTIDRHLALLPPALAELMLRLRDSAPPASILAAGRTPAWLFPGVVPGQHLACNYLVRQLNSHGIRARPSRTGALISLATDLPAPVLADLLGLHINTGVRWVQRSRRDWASYIATRVEQTP